MLRKIAFCLFVTSVSILTNPLGLNAQIKSVTSELRAPAYPLVTIDPYTSAWSTTDNLYDSPVKHWTGRTHSLIGALRVDGHVYRFLGKEDIPLKTIVPMANEVPWDAKYLLETPQEGWEQTTFDDSSWKIGKAAFGSPGMASITTVWDTKDIWVRREFTVDKAITSTAFYLIYSHDDDFELYLNGKQIVNTGQAAKSKVMLKIDGALLVKGGKNVIAAHCHDRGGLSYVDFGIFTDSDQKEVFSEVAVQKSVSISATQTHYEFTCGPVNLKLQFVSPLLPSELDILSRPVNYINYSAISTDGKKHDVQIYFETTPQWSVNENAQEVQVTKGKTADIGFLKAGTVEQAILKRKGDDVGIDWGYIYLAAKESPEIDMSIGDYFKTKEAFVKKGSLSGGEKVVNAKLSQAMPAMAYVEKLGAVTTQPAHGYIMIAYDDIESVQYFGDNLKGWWTKNGTLTFNDALLAASTGHDGTMIRCIEFDNKLWKETLEAGGKNYADLCVLAFRQSVAAHKLVKDKKGDILFLSKENFSNGSIGTVDVTYPSAPLFLVYNPELLKGMMNGIFYYSESGKWTKPFPSHDLGTYPLANGQTYGEDMPVEEAGNMLILTTAIAAVEGNAKYAEKHWKTLSVWADYLLQNGLDPENQLCTDDFAGHLAHNTNLSVKAIVAIAGYGKMAKMLGKPDVADKYTAAARDMAKRWVAMADCGDHFGLTFDKKDSWSQKYNMVWDKLLDLGLFPQPVIQKEVSFYLTKQNPYGLPLDNRATYSKTDWIIWTATLADSKETFGQFIDPLYKFVLETPGRVPMSDWFQTTDATQVGFQARSVVGGYYIKLLETKLKKNKK